VTEFSLWNTTAGATTHACWFLMPPQAVVFSIRPLVLMSALLSGRKLRTNMDSSAGLASPLSCIVANLDSSAGLASPLYTWCCQLGLIRRSGESLTHVMWPTCTHLQVWQVPYTRDVANLDSSAGLASPLHMYCSRGIIWPHAVLNCMVEYVFL